MKTLLVFFLAPVFAVHAINLENFYQIADNTLVTVQGQRFPALNFDSPLHEELAYRLKNPEQAAIIHQSYQKHIMAELPEELTQGFSKALIKVCYLFGSQKSSPERGFWIALREEGCSPWAEKRRQAIAAFVTEANRPACRSENVQKEGPFSIVILTTTASGGNESVTHGIVSCLSAHENIQTIVIDVETLAKETDPIMLASGDVTYDGLYASVFQQQGDEEILVHRDEVTRQIGKYIPSCLGSLLKERLLEIKPDLIISTRSYTLDDLPLATLDIPFRMLHCDYELSFFLLDIYGKVDSDRIRFWLPSMEPSVFKPLFAKANRLDLYNEGDNQQELREKVAFLLGVTPEEVQKQFECIGYPTRPEFKSITSAEELECLRKKWNIESEERAILVSMGKNGVGILETIYDRLTHLPPHHWKFIFVCGKNEELKTRLMSKLSSNFSNRFAIYGFLPPEEMNELMNLSLVKITKPGGAVTTEAFVTKTYLLMIGSHPWEVANGNKIEKLGFGQRFSDDLSFEAQIEDSLAKAKAIRTQSSTESYDWKKKLLNEIEILRHVKMQRMQK